MSAAIKTIDGLTLYGGDFPEPEAIVERVLYPGVTILGGRPKSGKSWLSLQLALAVALGKGRYLNWLPVRKKAKVLYLGLEEGESRTYSRLHKICAVEEFLERIHFCYKLEYLADGGYEQLDRSIKNDKYGLVIIDTLLRVSIPKSSNADVVGVDYREMNLLHDLATKHHVSIVVVHHSRKMAGEVVDTMIGTSGTTAACDCVWGLAKAKQGHYVLKVTGREVQESEFEMLKFPNPVTPWMIVAEGDGIGLSKERVEILNVLQNSGGLTSKDLSDVLGKSYSGTCKMLDRLAEANLVVRSGNGFRPLWKVNPDSPFNAVNFINTVHQNVWDKTQH